MEPDSHQRFQISPILMKFSLHRYRFARALQFNNGLARYIALMGNEAFHGVMQDLWCTDTRTSDNFSTAPFHMILRPLAHAAQESGPLSPASIPVSSTIYLNARVSFSVTWASTTPDPPSPATPAVIIVAFRTDHGLIL
jgi:hypothetical protein